MQLSSVYFDDTHRLLRDTLRRFVQKEVVPRGDTWEEQGFVPREVLREMGRCGFLGLRYPEQYNGGGMNALATALLAEELGRSGFGGFAATVLVHTDMASPHLAHAGSLAQLERWMPGIVAGDLITAVAVTEPDAGSDVKAIRGAARGRRLAAARHEDVHHQRRARGSDVRRRQDRPGGRREGRVHVRA